MEKLTLTKRTQRITNGILICIFFGLIGVHLYNATHIPSGRVQVIPLARCTNAFLSVVLSSPGRLTHIFLGGPRTLEARSIGDYEFKGTLRICTGDTDLYIGQFSNVNSATCGRPGFGHCYTISDYRELRDALHSYIINGTGQL